MQQLSVASIVNRNPIIGYDGVLQGSVPVFRNAAVTSVLLDKEKIIVIIATKGVLVYAVVVVNSGRVVKLGCFHLKWRNSAKIYSTQ